MIQMAPHLAQSGMKVLYVSGGVGAADQDAHGEVEDGLGQVHDLSRGVLERIREEIEANTFGLVVVDSIQTVCSETLDAPPGSVSQIRHCAGVLMDIAKSAGVTVFIVGHVTKDGLVRVPSPGAHGGHRARLRGGRYRAYRIVRTVKNRFGTSGEIGVFEMRSDGLTEVKDPSAIFIHGLGGESRGARSWRPARGAGPSWWRCRPW
jgi:DNA repair protein RadA/Sms